MGTGSWGLYVATPWVHVATPWVHVGLRDAARGRFVPWQPPAAGGPQTQRDQQQDQGKGRPPASAAVPGLYDVFVFDGADPAGLQPDAYADRRPAAERDLLILQARLAPCGS